MKHEDLLLLLEKVAAGEVAPEKAASTFRDEPYIRLGHGLCVDSHRPLRTGMGEVIFGPNKSNQQLASALKGLSSTDQPVLVTKLNHDQGRFLARKFPQGLFWDIPGLFVLNKEIQSTEPWPDKGDVLIISAGGSDLPLALEALGTALFYDLKAGLVSDVGVAGLHRLLPHIENIFQAKLLIVVAGMEGALPSVLAGMSGKPIIAVPSSVGYGASFSGIAPLLTMLNACAPGIAVVNIDNGFGAATMALKLLDIS